MASLTLAACQSDTYSIKGEAHPFSDGTVLYLTAAPQSDSHPYDSIIVKDGKFAYHGTVDPDNLWKLYVASQPESAVYYFAEPGNVYIELSDKPGCSRVSGTRANNEWQALNDTIAKYDNHIRQLFASDSISLRQKSTEMNRLYNIINDCISESTLRNRKNVLGRFISTHFE